MNDFINVIKKDPQVRVKINEALERYIRFPDSCQTKIGYALIQNVILKELVIIMGTTLTNLDIELKTKISRMEHLESKKNYH